MDSQSTPLRARYTVLATTLNKNDALIYKKWLCEDHALAVVQSGANWAEVVDLDVVREESENHLPVYRIETRYGFKTRMDYELYISDFAPRLRAEGIRLFGPTSGRNFEFQRFTGNLVACADSPAAKSFPSYKHALQGNFRLVLVARMQDKEVADDLQSYLRNEVLMPQLEAGVLRAEVVELETEDPTLEIRLNFVDRNAYENYRSSEIEHIHTLVEEKLQGQNSRLEMQLGELIPLVA